MSETPVIPADAFQGFRDLLSLLGNEKRAMRTLNALEDRLTKVTEAEAKLAGARASHDQTVAKERAELEDKAAKLRAKEISLIGREAIAERTLEREKADRLDRARPLAGGMSITRE